MSLQLYNSVSFHQDFIPSQPWGFGWIYSASHLVLVLFCGVNLKQNWKAIGQGPLPFYYYSKFFFYLYKCFACISVTTSVSQQDGTFCHCNRHIFVTSEIQSKVLLKFHKVLSGTVLVLPFSLDIRESSCCLLVTQCNNNPSIEQKKNHICFYTKIKTDKF